MATTQRGKKDAPSMSQAIRDYLERHPDAANADVVSGLQGEGVAVSAGLVSSVRSNLAKKQGRRKSRGRRGAAAAAARQNGAATAADVSKAELIRQAFIELGRRTRPRDIIIAVREKHGVTVSAAQVVTTRKKMRKAARRRRAMRAGAPTKSVKSAAVSLDQLIAAKLLADQLGGIDATKRVLDTLEQLR